MAEPIKYQIGKLPEEGVLGISEFQAEKYDSREEAEKALAAMDNSKDYTIAEVR